jgi:hypothetical protein
MAQGARREGKEQGVVKEMGTYIRQGAGRKAQCESTAGPIRKCYDMVLLSSHFQK